MLDFGPRTATGGDLTNSMYHSAEPTFGDDTWNQVGTSDLNTLVWSDGSAATGLTLNLGNTLSESSTVVGLSNTPSAHVLGGGVSTGIYDGTSVATDGIFKGNSGQVRYVGFQLSGLPAGSYDIYVNARYTNKSYAHVQNVYVGSGPANSDFDAVTLAQTGALTYGSGQDLTAEWVEDGNYLKFSFSLGEGESLNLAVTGDNLNAVRRGFLNSVQIVRNGEESPGTVIFLSSAGWVMLLAGLAVWRFGKTETVPEKSALRSGKERAV